jgi:ABC-2 type transport system ATP-binding protein
MARVRGVSVLLSTHSLDEVEQVCDRVVILNRGHLVAEGTVAEVARRASAPRRAVVRVPAELHSRAVEVLHGAVHQVHAGEHPGEVMLGFAQGAAPEDSCADALGRLLAAGVPVLGLTLEGGRLSDAFLSLTGEG